MQGIKSPDAAEIFVIGYGNRNRRDDGVGPCVADLLNLELGDTGGVRILSLHQLGPELAEDLNSASGVIFIDADDGQAPGSCSWNEVIPGSDIYEHLHDLTAEALLFLTQLVYGSHPAAWMVSVHGGDFGFGEGLSREAEDGAAKAAGEIAFFIRQNRIFGLPADRTKEYSLEFL
jgi:hydrogenase maturation protease